MNMTAETMTTKFVAGSRLLVISMLLLEIPSIWLVQTLPEWTMPWRVLHLVQMLLLIGLVLKSRSYLRQQDSHWISQCHFILAALGLSLVGDLINSGLIDFSAITDQRHLLSIGPFAAAQIVYIMVFWRSSSVSPNHSESDSISNFKLAGLVLWLPISVGLWFSIFTEWMPTIIERATLFYACLVMLMGITSTWIWRVWGDIGSWVTIGALLFLISDALIGSALSRGGVPEGVASHIIWATYFAAQCFIARLPMLGLAMEARTPDYPPGYEEYVEYELPPEAAAELRDATAETPDEAVSSK